MSNSIGILFATIAFTSFGMYPLYFKQMDATPPLQITCHRVVWSFPLLVPLFLWKSDWRNFFETVLTRHALRHHTISAMALGGTWVFYHYGVSAGYLVEVSLGFFINPVLTVLLAFVVLKEPLRRWQQLAVFFAAGGVVVVAIGYGQFPWLGICLGMCLSSYGFMKKTSPMGSIDGILVEITVLLVPCLVAVVVLEAEGSGVFMHSSAKIDWLLIGSGVATVVPLLFYASAAQKISFTLLGLLQYIGPMLTFAIGVFIYHEDFSTAKLIGFVLVWVALTIFAVEGITRSRTNTGKSPPAMVATSADNTGNDVVVIATDGPTTPVDGGFTLLTDDDTDDSLC